MSASAVAPLSGAHRLLESKPASAIYEGLVTHSRRHPRTHSFTYRLFHVYLDLAELHTVFADTRWWRLEQAAPASFRRRDFLPGPLPLADQVRDLVAERIAHRPQGPIRLLTQVRTFGIAFNPVSFYYCFAHDETLEAIVAEITNIPWLERHCYVLDCRGRAPEDLEFSLDKRFHISPFMGMRQQYRWRFSVPGQTLQVHMTSSEDERDLFTATLAHQRGVLNPRTLDALLWRYPLMPLTVVGGIHAQAAWLWWKGVPFYAHPGESREIPLIREAAENPKVRRPGQPHPPSSDFVHAPGLALEPSGSIPGSPHGS